MDSRVTGCHCQHCQQLTSKTGPCSSLPQPHRGMGSISRWTRKERRRDRADVSCSAVPGGPLTSDACCESHSAVLAGP